MRTRSAFFTGFLILLSLTLIAGTSPTAVPGSETEGASQTYGVEMLWNNSMQVYDVTISKDGKYLAAANDTGLYYFAANNPTPIWWFNQSGPILSVALSVSGEYVVAGNTTGSIVYFNNATVQTDFLLPTWISVGMGGPIERGTLDISDNGDYVALGGTGANMWYYANCTTRSGIDQLHTWVDWLNAEVNAVDMSSDGQYVAAGGTGSGPGFVAFYTNATRTTQSAEPAWLAVTSLPGPITDVAVSDDGYAVASTGFSTASLHYWANATSLSRDPNATWTMDSTFKCLDMSSDGNNIVAAGMTPLSLHYWANATQRQGIQPETWTKLVSEDVLGVAISDDGSLIAASSQTFEPSYKTYFFTPDGSMIGNFTLNQGSNVVSMSAAGSITAVGGPGYDSLYLFGLITDSTPPIIGNVYQQPANDSVHPEDAVMIFANVTDDLSGVQQVLLNFTNGNGTWITTPMQNLHENWYNASIPQYPYCTYITYIIIATDNDDNTITTQEMGYTYQYHVISEFLHAFLVPMFIAATFSTAILHKKRKHPRKP